MTANPRPDRASRVLPADYDGLRTLQAEFDRYQRAAFPTRSSRFFALELAGETGELANLEKKRWKGREVDAADFEDEAADVCIALLNFVNSRKIDLARAVRRKMRKIDRIRLARPESASPDPAAAEAEAVEPPVARGSDAVRTGSTATGSASAEAAQSPATTDRRR